MSKPSTRIISKDTEALLKRYDEAADKRWIPKFAAVQKAAARSVPINILRYQVFNLEERNNRSIAKGAKLPLMADPKKWD